MKKYKKEIDGIPYNITEYTTEIDLGNDIILTLTIETSMIDMQTIINKVIKEVDND